MKKRILSVLLAIVMLVGLMPAVALAAGEHSHLLCQTANCTLDHNGDEDGTGHSDADKVTFVEWTDALATEQNGNGKTAANSLPKAAGNYYLTADVTLSNTWTVFAGVTLCLNGHSITRGTGAQGSTTITVASSKSLTITDCSTKPRKGYIETDNWGNNTYWTELSEGAVPGGKTPLDLTGGIINSEKSGYYGGEYVVSIDGGAFTLYGGNLSGSKCDVVSVASGTFTMYGGNITGNKAQGVDVKSSGDFTMNGGTISYNGARGVSVGGEFIMNNGNISNNKTDSNDGGGVQVSNGTFIMNGGTISGNKAGDEGGGVYVGGGEFIMNNGNISNNEARNNGGGVCVFDNGEFTMTGGNITGNTTRRFGGGVYFPDNTFNLSGGIITGNRDESSAANNVEFDKDSYITVCANLSDGTEIGVTTWLGTFTSGGAAYVNNFKSDNPAYRVDVDGNNLKLVDPPDRTISMAADPENGTVDIPNIAGEGTTVTITATPDEGYEVDTVKYYETDDEANITEVAMSNNTGTFTMPAYDVTVSVTFRKLEILQQPAADNGYTVIASGTPTYQWYKVIESEDGFLVTEEFLKNGNGIVEGHGTYDSTTGNWTAAGSYLYGYFMIYMNSGETLTVTFSNVLESAPFMTGCNLGTYADVTTEDNQTYVFTAPYDAGDAKTRDIYMLLFMPSDEDEVPTMRAVYKGSALESIGQTNAALDTDGLASGTYVCRVTWNPGSSENYSGIYTLSEPVEYTAPAPAPAPKPAPSGGSSSSGITSKTEKNEDGSSTTTTTNRITGTVTETTKNTDGTTGTTVTDKSGNITAVSATVPAVAASAAEKTGKPVTVPVEVPVAKHSEDALPIKVEIPAGGVTVEIPVENVTPGTVVVIVAKDGTEQVVRTSSVSETGVVVNLAQDATVKVVDMSHNFVDVHPVNHWATDAIDFVAARGIFNGTSADVFTPDGSMTRQAMWMTLARMSGEEPADMAAAREWAVANAVSDGSRPLETVTRQQYVTMLWRWAAAEGMDISAGEETNLLSFTDADKISDYAVEAFRWACGEGIVDGYNDDTLRAMTNASRAHAAAMMMRFCAGMVN